MDVYIHGMILNRNPSLGIFREPINHGFVPVLLPVSAIGCQMQVSVVCSPFAIFSTSEFLSTELSGAKSLRISGYICHLFTVFCLPTVSVLDCLCEWTNRACFHLDGFRYVLYNAPAIDSIGVARARRWTFQTCPLLWLWILPLCCQRLDSNFSLGSMYFLI